MEPLVFKCPDTGMPIIAPLKLDTISYPLFASKNFSMACPCCGIVRTWKIADGRAIKRAS